MARVMGIVNVTPDSFSDGGLFLDPGRAIEHGRELAAEGADILDVGGESTRPGAEGVAAEVELERTAPVVAALAADAAVPVSIDTSKAEVARAALDAGATIVNDVTALRADPELAAVCAERDCELVLMHMQGSPRTMQDDPPTTTSSTTSGPSSPSGSRWRSRPASARSASGSTRGSASARPPSTTSSCCAASASCASSAGRS